MNSIEMPQEIASKLWKEAIELRGSRKKGKIKKAINLVKRIIEERNNPSDISVKLNTFIGDCYHLDLKKHDEAIDYYHTAIEINNDPWANVMVGDIFLNHKRDYKAAADILKATLDRGISKPLIRDIAQDYLAEATKKIANFG